MRRFVLLATCAALAACAEPAPLPEEDTVTAGEIAEADLNAAAIDGSQVPPRTVVEALAPYYAQLEYDPPLAPEGPPLPARDAVLTKIAFGSCNTSEREIPILDVVAQEDADLFMYIGDNVYGDAYSWNPDLVELREAYHLLAARPEFQRLRSEVPMLATWDDHDYGLNDAGAVFPYKGFAETLFEDFWRVPEDDPRRDRAGIYTAETFGPEGRRVQIILLDTRWFRGVLTPTDERGVPGKERYLPSEDESQTMLGEEQWAWLEEQLRQPADLRLLVSSIQVHADGHGWEAWRMLPHERERLYGLIRETGAEGVVLVSGDRHSAGLYVREDVADYPLYEITSSSLNMSFQDENNEPGPHRIGDMYALVNYGVIAIDWEAGTLGLDIRDIEGEAVRAVSVPLAEIGVE
ncbi:alkaline phosphatase family protein [Marinicauda algicola]|uniref:Alkaline phosphatase family protein n=1 Tax=Marinicauda algicola TaxID=2029849 RepID=A0A4S2H140_9PROT|nr:alkaline phosphatase D family protein [Marinicauda algicola]TGY89250.1 alkaline phosphatase family protein [Marinicauda algicola]